MDFIYKEEYAYPHCVCLNLTDNCNLACKYCFVQQKPHYMSLDIAKQAVDFVVSNLLKKRELTPCDDLDSASVAFFGGEPMLLFDELIVPVVEYAENKYPNLIEFNITTNGTLLNKERIDFFKAHNIPILLSIDGDRQTQEFNRPCRDKNISSFDLVTENIPYLLENFPCTTFRATLYQYTIDQLFNNYVYAIEQGFQNIFMCPNAREVWTAGNIEKLHIEIHKIFNLIESCFRLNLPMPIQNGQIDRIFQKILEHDITVINNENIELFLKREVTRCGIGTGSASINYQGFIFGCQEQDSRDTNDYFYIGNIFDGIDINRHRQMLIDYNQLAKITCENPEKCDTCKIRKNCLHDICPSVSHDMFNNFFIRPEIDCLFDQFLYEDALKIMSSLVKDNNESFKQYLQNIYNDYLKED